MKHANHRSSLHLRGSNHTDPSDCHGNIPARDPEVPVEQLGYMVREHCRYAFHTRRSGACRLHAGVARGKDLDNRHHVPLVKWKLLTSQEVLEFDRLVFPTRVESVPIPPPPDEKPRTHLDIAQHYLHYPVSTPRLKGLSVRRNELDLHHPLLPLHSHEQTAAFQPPRIDKP